MDPRVINACHRAQDYTNKTGKLAYVFWCKSARRYEVLIGHPSGCLAADYRFVAESEL